MPWKKGTAGAKWEEDKDDAHRAIGRYVVTFSELVREMREIACQYVAKGVTDMDIASLLLGEATAAPVASAYFGLCWTLGGLDEDEQRVWGVLRNDVKDAIEMRNDIAHGDWEIGNVSVRSTGDDEDVTIMPPRLIRIHPTRREGAFQTKDLTISDIDALSDGLEHLIALVEDFGKLALKLPVFTHGEKHSVSTGKYRVRDVLTVTGRAKNPSKQRPSRRSKAKIERNGPHADKVRGGLYSSLSSRQASSAHSSDP